MTSMRTSGDERRAGTERLRQELEDAGRDLQSFGLDATTDYAAGPDHWQTEVRRSFPEARVGGYEPLISLCQNNEKDRLLPSRCSRSRINHTGDRSGYGRHQDHHQER